MRAMAKESEDRREDLVEISSEPSGQAPSPPLLAPAGTPSTAATCCSWSMRPMNPWRSARCMLSALQLVHAGPSCAHCIGIVPISHESVFVAASSVHCADALLACHFIIDEIKSSVPLWKKEVYSDGQVWKENAEFFAKKKSCCRHAGGAMKESSHDAGNLCVDKDAQHGMNEDNAEGQFKAIDLPACGR